MHLKSGTFYLSSVVIVLLLLLLKEIFIWLFVLLL